MTVKGRGNHAPLFFALRTRFLMRTNNIKEVFWYETVRKRLHNERCGEHVPC